MTRSPRLAHLLAAAPLLLLPACGERPTASSVASGPSSHSPPNSTPTSDRPGKRDIYGADRRREASSVEREALSRAVDGTAVLVDETNLHASDGAESIALGAETLQSADDLCPEERFADQPGPGFCTAFLIAPDRVATAGHCVDAAEACARTRVAFGFTSRTLSERGERPELPRENIYACEEIVARDRQPDGVDYAILRLDRRVDDRVPLALHTDGIPTPGRPLAIVGHPMGLPMKVGFGGEVRATSDDQLLDYALDTYGGNSGSPVVDPETGVVHALHTRGTRDFEWREDRQCRTSRVCREVEEVGDCSGNAGTNPAAFDEWATRSADDETYTAGDSLVRTPDGRLRAQVDVPEPDRRVAVEIRVAGETTHPASPLLEVVPPGASDPTTVESISIDGRFHTAVPLPRYVGDRIGGTWRVALEGRDLRGVEIDHLAVALRSSE